jgi:hypothetical protein
MFVSSDGEYIKIYEAKEVHVHFQEELPEHYMNLYLSAAKVVSQIR